MQQKVTLTNKKGKKKKKITFPSLTDSPVLVINKDWIVIFIITRL